MVSKRGLPATLLFLAMLLAACGTGADSTTRPDEPAVPTRDVEFTTSDGITLTGRLFGSGRVGIVLAHMFPADATSWYGAAEELAHEGYAVIAFNFRGYADSRGSRDITKAPIDIEAAQRFLERSGVRRSAFVGASMGGTASLIAAEGLDPSVVVAISAPLRFMGLDAAVVATRIQRPVLLLAANADESAFQDLEVLARALPNPDTRVFEGGAHGTDLLVDRPEAVAEILRFLERYAPARAPEPTPG